MPDTNKIDVEKYGYSAETGVVMTTAVKLGILDGTPMWTLPVEPVVSLRGKRNVAISNVLKKTRRGSIKEYWSIDDYEITITGALWTNAEGVYPAEQVARLKKILESKEPVMIESMLTDAFGVHYIVPLSWDFGDDKGVEWQNYRITAISDNEHDLVI